MNKRIKKKKGIYTKFKDKETWDLGYTVAAFTLPRLKRYKKLNNGVPGAVLFQVNEEKIHFNNDEERLNNAKEKWDAVLDRIIWSFEQIVNPTEEPELEKGEDWKDYRMRYDVYSKKVQDGINLFAKHFQDLWW